MYQVKPGKFLVLASSSPRRSELLAGCGLEFTVLPSDVDESEIPSETPQAMVERLALAKARYVAHKLSITSEEPPLLQEIPGANLSLAISELVKQKNAQFGEFITVGADTTVSIAGKILGKPRNIPDAVGILSELSAKEHSVFSSIALLRGTETLQVSTFETKVKFLALTKQQIDSYIATGEPMDKAGAYGIQGVGLHLVDSVNGSFSNVVGLNIAALIEQLLKFQVIELR